MDSKVHADIDVQSLMRSSGAMLDEAARGIQFRNEAFSPPAFKQTSNRAKVAMISSELEKLIPAGNVIIKSAER